VAGFCARGLSAGKIFLKSRMGFFESALKGIRLHRIYFRSKHPPMPDVPPGAIRSEEDAHGP